ncbi:hypothetical protein KAU08_10460 [bacterium]|nr:hypothetical protein [bacterium]
MMEILKTNAEIRNDASSWVKSISIILDRDKSLKTAILGPFIEPWTLAVTIGELIDSKLRWREIAPDNKPRMKRLQVTHTNNLLDWARPDFKIIRVRPDNLFDPPSRAEMLELLNQFLDKRASIGDIFKIEGGWAVSIASPGVITDTMPGFTIRDLTNEEIDELPDATQSGKRTVSVSSPRIDAVAAKVLKPSREKVKKHLESRGVLLNYKPARKPGIELVPGDIVAVRGGGRFRFNEILGSSKKGRIQVEVEILNGP